jgi:hypothetical protein
MRLAILIGASKDTKESPLVPLGVGEWKMVSEGLHDSVYEVLYENGMRSKFAGGINGSIVIGGQAIKLQQVNQGTERAGSINIFAEEYNPDGYEPTES